MKKPVQKYNFIQKMLVTDVVTGKYIEEAQHLYNIKIFQNIKKLWSAQEFGLKICSGEITKKRTKQELSFLHATLLLDLIYVPTKYYQIAQKVLELWLAQDFCFWGDKYITKKELTHNVNTIFFTFCL